MNLKEFEEKEPGLIKKREETLKYLKTLEQHERAIKSLASLGEYLTTREDVTSNVVDAWHTLSDFIMGFDNE